MSLPSAYQGQLEDRMDDTLDALYMSITNDDRFDDMLKQHIDDAIAQVNSWEDPFDPVDLWDDAVQALQERFGGEFVELKRENSMLKDNVKSLQAQLQEAYKKIS
jgi:predicted  nucleic acid-binding Zn-ribbon protein